MKSTLIIGPQGVGKTTEMQKIVSIVGDVDQYDDVATNEAIEEILNSSSQKDRDVIITTQMECKDISPKLVAIFDSFIILEKRF